MSFEIDLSGRRALVTGAGQHNGRAIARALAEAGAEVSVNDIVAERAGGVAREIEAAGGAARAAVFDVTDSRAAHAAIAEHAPDILVNNAGDTGAGNAPGSAPVFSTALFLDSDPANWSRLIDVNLYGVMYSTHAAPPAMIERGWGRVVNLVSRAGLIGIPGSLAYATGKGGVFGLTNVLSRDLVDFGITVNAVNPASTETRMVTGTVERLPDETRRAKLRAAMQRPQQVAVRFGV